MAGVFVIVVVFMLFVCAVPVAVIRNGRRRGWERPLVNGAILLAVAPAFTVMIILVAVSTPR